MIIRLPGEGQFELDDRQVDRLNALDQQAVDALSGQESANFGAVLKAMADLVRAHGLPLADDSLVPSDAILPPADATLEEVEELLDEDGLVPG